MHPAHIRSKLVHPLVHNTRSKSLNKRDGSTCYKICTYESGSGKPRKHEHLLALHPTRILSMLKVHDKN